MMKLQNKLIMMYNYFNKGVMNMSIATGIKGKIITDFTQEERQKMTDEERKYLRESTKEILRNRGYYKKVRKMSKVKPLDPNVKEDYMLGKGMGIF